MADYRDFRSLALRVERGFHRRPNAFRRAIWMAGGVLSALFVVWVALALGRGQTAHFAAGPISAAHHMFENDCAACHTTWAPVDQLLSPKSAVSSISSEKCLKCHPAPAHQPSLAAPHGIAHEFSCGECHREHRGRKSLIEVTDAFCTKCHADLQSPEHGAGKRFASSIENFDGRASRGSHPEFGLLSLLKSKQPATKELRPGLEVVAWKARDDDQGTELAGDRWQDAAVIRFNHKAHLRPVDEHGEPQPGVRDGEGKLQDLSQNCQKCHEIDAQGRYMLPISYDRHCQECHPLRFDDLRFPGMAVPHRAPVEVRGFLMEKYAGLALGKQAAEKADPGAADGYVDLPYAPRIPRELAGQLQEQINGIEKGLPIPVSAANAEHTLFGPEARGGCRYCHDVKEPADGELWKIEKPQIPRRWLPHSQFRHQSHSLLKCRDCHSAANKAEHKTIDESFSTGDVLMPDIAVCQSCHSKSPKWDFSEVKSQSMLQSAGMHCVECHKYHPSAAYGTKP
ncbi:MAG: hypothetical protein JSS02_15600 [Planctomycetes bacterium]|nr:hypothetical protein [Planctomycetota bacterium]